MESRRLSRTPKVIYVEYDRYSRSYKDLMEMVIMERGLVARKIKGNDFHQIEVTLVSTVKLRMSD